MTREEIYKDQMKDFIKVHKAFPKFKASRQDVAYMSEVASPGGSALFNHMLLFTGTIAG